MSPAGSRPLITFALISYREEAFIRQAVEGAFSQTYEPLEIVLSNDCSPDRTFDIMKSMAAGYRGPHRVILNRNERNLGTAAHVNRIMELSSGRIVVIAAGDDISEPGRTAALAGVFEQGQGRIKSVFSNALMIDAAGRAGLAQYIEPLPPDEFSLAGMVRKRDFGIVAGSSHAWTRDLFEVFGPLRTPLGVEDSAIAFRAALLGGIAFTDRLLVRHRRHAGNTWHYTVTDPVASLRYKTVERDAVWRSWLQDVRTLEAREPGRSKELGEYARVLTERIESVQDDLILFRSSWSRRAALIAARTLSGMPLRNAARSAAIFLAPALYRRFDALRAARQSGSPAAVRQNADGSRAKS